MTIKESSKQKDYFAWGVLGGAEEGVNVIDGDGLLAHDFFDVVKARSSLA